MRETRLLGPDNNEVVARQTRQNTKAIENAVAARDGEQGKSAYEVALDNGFSGSEASWLLSLQGSDGQDGSPGAPGVGLQGPRGPAALLATVTSYNSTNKTATVDIAGSAFLDLPNYSGFVLAANDPVVLVELISGTLVVVGVGGDASDGGGGGGGGGTLDPSYPFDPKDMYQLANGGVSNLQQFASGNLSALGLYENSLVVFYSYPSHRVFVCDLDNLGTSTDLGNPGAGLSGGFSQMAVINGRIFTSSGRYFDGTWKAWYPYTLQTGSSSAFYDATTDCMYVLTRSGSSGEHRTRIWTISADGPTENYVGGPGVTASAVFGDGHILFKYGTGSAQAVLMEMNPGGTYSSIEVGDRQISGLGVDASGNEWGIDNPLPGTESTGDSSLYKTNQANSRATYWNVLKQPDDESESLRYKSYGALLDAGDVLIGSAVLGFGGINPDGSGHNKWTPYVYSFDKTGEVSKLLFDYSYYEPSDGSAVGFRWTDAFKSSFAFIWNDQIFRISLS